MREVASEEVVSSANELPCLEDPGAELPKLLDVLLVGETYLDDVKIDPVEYAGLFGSLSVAGDSACHAGAGWWFLAGSGFGEDSVGDVGHGGRCVGVMGCGREEGFFFGACFCVFWNRVEAERSRIFPFLFCLVGRKRRQRKSICLVWAGQGGFLGIRGEPKLLAAIIKEIKHIGVFQRG